MFGRSAACSTRCSPARRAFEGENVSITLAAVLTKEPDWAALPASAASALRRLLRSCLEKDPRRRLQAMGDARLEIERLLSGAPEEAATLVIPVARPLWHRAAPWAALAGVLGLALLTMLLLWPPWRIACSGCAGAVGSHYRRRRFRRQVSSFSGGLT